MKELIKEAERLYKNIDETQSHLIKARLDKDRIREHLELIGLETIVFDAKQLLKCIIDRKDNIVDLSKIWKDGKVEKPLPYSDIVVRDCCITTNHEDVVDESQWAYIDDLLPKGGE